MRRVLLVWLTSFLLPVAILPVKSADAQQSPKEERDAKEATQAKPEHVYRLDYILNELQNGKRINSRSYTLMVGGGSFGPYQGLHVGSRIPMSIGKEQWQYFDLGVKINSGLKERDNQLLIETSPEMNSVAPRIRAHQCAVHARYSQP
jgi:hypothetical protein